MARQYTAGTATDGGGSPTTNMTNLQATLRTIITANAAWSLVETINGSSNVVDVFKCAAASSGLPKDFYFVLSRAVVGGNYTMYLGEDYNSGTHVLTNVAAIWSASNRTLDTATGLFNPANSLTFSASTGSATASGASAATSSVGALATMPYEVIVDSDHLVIRLGTGTQSARYVGALESLVTAVADPMPIAMISLSGTAAISGNSSGATRNPGTIASIAQTHGLNDVLLAQNNVDLYPGVGLKDTTIVDPWIGGVGAYEVGATNSSSPSGIGVIRGKIKKTRKVYNPPAGTAVGDTFTIAGRQWRVVGVSGSSSACLVDPGP